MHIEEYVHEKHFEFLAKWLKARSLSSKLAEKMPEFGFIIFHKSIPIAVGFLRQVEGHIGIIEGLCTNPEIDGDVRNVAIDAIVEELIEQARGLEIQTIFAWSQDKHTLARSLKHGFEKSPNTLITLDLMKNSVIH